MGLAIKLSCNTFYLEGTDRFIRLNGVPNSKCDPKSKQDWRSGETVTSHTKIGTYQELCFYFLHRTEVGCETSATMATERSAQINGLNLSVFFWMPRL